jgi:hypothetical protein
LGPSVDPTCTIASASTWSESYPCTLFFGLDHARQVIGAWTDNYNIARPHSSLGYQTPAAYAATLTATGARLLGHARLTSNTPPHHRWAASYRGNCSMECLLVVAGEPKAAGQDSARLRRPSYVRFSALRPKSRRAANHPEADI